MFFAAIVLFGLAKMRGVEIDFRSDWKYFVVIGLANSALPYWLFSWAETSLSASVASILNAMSPIFGMLIGAVWLRSPLRPITVVGMIVSFLGVVGLMGFNPAEFGRSGIWPALGCLAATVSYGFAANYTKTRSKAISPLAAATGSQMVAVVALAPLALATIPAQMPGVSALGAAVLLGVLCTGVALALFFQLIADIGASNTLTVTFIAPVFGVLWAALFLSEPLSLVKVGACAMILLGTWLATRPAKQPSTG